MARAPVEDLLHRINNLIGTIELQAAVAATDGGLDAHRQALRLIAESAARTRQEVERFRGGAGDVRSQAGS